MEFINPWMLFGLAGVSLPIVAHLLNRKRFSVVDWGAMQFLDLGKRSRRRMRLEELLLLLLRILMIALICLAISRPWVDGGLLSRVSSGQSRDIVLVIDGSYSMQRKGPDGSLHDEAKQIAARFLSELGGGDSVALLDVRDHVRPVIVPPTRDIQRIRDALDELPDATGSANFPESLTRGIQILQSTTNVAREIIVITDGQRHGWHVDDSVAWRRLDDFRKLSSVKPRIWTYNVGAESGGNLQNFSIEQLRVQREQTVKGFPIRLQTKVSAGGTSEPAIRTVKLEVDGEVVPDEVRTIRIEPDGETPVEFEYKFDDPGPHVVAAVLDDDLLAPDNRAEMAVFVGPGVPVLIVDGDPQLDPAKSESFFLEIAFGGKDNPNAWIEASVVPWTAFPKDELDAYDVVVLANVPRLTDDELEAVEKFVASGKGLLVAAGDDVDQDWYETEMYKNGRSMLPARMLEVARTDGNILEAGMVLNPDQLSADWLERFKGDGESELTRARFARWWRVLIPEPMSRDERASWDRKKPLPGTTIVSARFDNNAPYIISRGYGRGRVAMLTVPLDADWSTLPARRDFVPFVHELMFYLATVQTRLNVGVGEPLSFPLDEDRDGLSLEFVDSVNEPHDVELAGPEKFPVARLSNTLLPGQYRLQERTDQAGILARFVVRESREESNLDPLTEAERESLIGDERMQIVSDFDELKSQMFKGENRAELWGMLLWMFVVLLLGETFLARRMLRGSHEPDTDEDPENAEDYGDYDEVEPVYEVDAPLEEVVQGKQGNWNRHDDID